MRIYRELFTSCSRGLRPGNIEGNSASSTMVTWTSETHKFRLLLLEVPARDHVAVEVLWFDRATECELHYSVRRQCRILQVRPGCAFAKGVFWPAKLADRIVLNLPG